MKYFLIVFSLLLFTYCSDLKRNKKEEPVARVLDKYLYPRDIQDIFPSNISKSDSVIVARDFIEKWIKQQLLLNKAELNLTDAEKNVDKQIENYRTSLLIYKYEQSLIKEKLDTFVSSQEIVDYYNENSSNFLLNANIVKALFLQVPRTSPEIWKARRWYRSENEEDIKKLEDYCYQYATKYDYFNDNWIYFSEIEKILPIKIDNPESYLKYRKFIEIKDSTYYYFVSIKDYRLVGTVSPLETVRENIRNIIFNKRKISLIKELEFEIYNDALNRNNFTIY
jgi:Fe-S cluster biosynthesis and repair protein YggX